LDPIDGRDTLLPPDEGGAGFFVSQAKQLSADNYWRQHLFRGAVIRF
jgi:hypothetical protein